MTNQNFDAFVSRAIEKWDLEFEQTLQHARSDISLASGLSGYLMLESALYQQAPAPARKERIHMLFQFIVEGLESRPQQAGLWTGLLGPLYVFEYIRRTDQALVPEEVAEFIDSMDDHLIAATKQAPERMHFDLIVGLCGFGAYALMRTDAEAGRRIYAAVEQALAVRAERREDGLTWLTPVRFAGVDLRHMGDHIDFGVAHGVAGIIGMIAGAIRADLHTVRSKDMLAQAIRCLRGHALPEHKISTFSTMSHYPEQSSRAAWCYGDLGIGCALLLASEALNDPAQKTFAEHVLRKRCSSSAEKLMVFDSGLCHGHAGNWRMGQRIAARAAIDEVDSMTAHCIATILGRDLALQVHEGSPNFLEGQSGALMALVSAGWNEDRPWDTCMNFGF
ncbi:lanthionine synthetase LanC family protein [Duganella violaceipulchra]|uniref:Lanthionine synthetase n=1 Tax=Duganella violaceipulchra TaxID=2849652 RepID=A0AA41L1E6_9BURK|nr:lanthionine synthetase LanC family protein [Duganella violaceicalia]MBV6320623.1 hypothetical protein [Duganella violaceicalia]MCP2008668.1 hypothetical protein [Duganella violaceicalia]